MAEPDYDGEPTQRLSEFDRLNAPPLDVIPPATSLTLPIVSDSDLDTFARLIPSNPAAIRAFHEIAVSLDDPAYLPHSRAFIHLDERPPPPSRPVALESPQIGQGIATSHDPAPSSPTSSLSDDDEPEPRPQRTGYFCFSMFVLPSDFRSGWIIGAGRSDKVNLGVDLLITLNGERDFVRGRHARLVHHPTTSMLMLKTVSGALHVSINAEKIDRNGRVVSWPSQSIDIGNLTYTLEYSQHPAVKSRYTQALRDLLAANPGFNSYPTTSLDPTPSSNHYHLGNYSIQTPQASGTYGTVSAAVDLKTGEVYAVKKLTRTKYNFDLVAHEVNMMKYLGSHPHICVLHNVLFSDGDEYGMGDRKVNEVFMILSPLATKTLAELIGASEDRALLLRALHQTAQGVRYVHSRGIIHRDLKPNNLLVTDPFRVVVADFGHATRELHSKDHLKGTMAYLPPEIIDLKISSRSKGSWSAASDVFAFGVVGFELLHGMFKRRSSGIIDDTILGLLRGRVENSHTEFDAILQTALRSDPQKRPSMRDICLAPVWPGPETEVNNGKRKSIPT
ncbi:hypothetical protein B0A52_05166 [Exophiala mesophila]|uniref:non-specific serine/threonine protein kinase n=1 Tax=Exophiala mesophila TaxID=212818 RepID=A0A438N453_EXOME|nr:hypothetical protein B0A52_05166 [Exophiala mesophila]